MDIVSKYEIGKEMGFVTPGMLSVTLEIKLSYPTEVQLKGHKKLSLKGLANLKRVEEFRAKKSKFVRAEEFAGKGKTLEVLDVEYDVNGKFGDTIQIKFKEPKTNTERIRSTWSIRAINAIYPLLEQGVLLMHVWTTGKAMDSMYYADDAKHRKVAK